jgi:hypothetical protein
MPYADRVIELADGRLQADGKPERFSHAHHGHHAPARPVPRVRLRDPHAELIRA